jgi:hypothetical protein
MKIQSLPTYLRPFQKKSLAAVFFLALLDFFGNEAKKKASCRTIFYSFHNFLNPCQTGSLKL